MHLNINKVVHRDLKPANIMVSKEGVVKIIDFGISRIFEEEQEEMMQTYTGTPLYMAPEVFFGKKYTETADLWSLGVILF